MKDTDSPELLDFFAAAATPPGAIEIAKVAGVGVDRNFTIYRNKDDKFGVPFNEWWISLTLEQQSEFIAKAKYTLARAMMKARNEN